MKKETKEALKRIIDQAKHSIKFSPDNYRDMELIDKLIKADEETEEEQEERSCVKCGKTSGLIEEEDMCYTCAEERGRI